MNDAPDIILREPGLDDGSRLHGLVRELHPLAQNSVYCNLLQCTYFSATTVVAERAGELLGFVTGFLLPADPSTYFLWQVGVHEQGRGEKLPLRMIRSILAREACAGVTTLQATVSENNDASRGFFFSLAREENAECTVTEGYLPADYFGADNPHAEDLFVIRPLSTPTPRAG